VRHVGKSLDELLAILDDMRLRVANGDSFEGSIEYLMSEPVLGAGVDADFAVLASYRVGNTLGQGSVRLIRDITPEPDPKLGLGPAACPICGSMGAAALMADHIAMEHPGSTEEPF
jgi:hypothetical protein